VATWYTTDEARADWIGAPLDDERLQSLLDVSQAECVAFSPLPADSIPGEIPDGHRWAHLEHARNIWNAVKVNPSGGFGDDTQGFAMTPFPMDWAVRARLRPRVIFGGSVG
jgi:hypothetical protein